MYMGFAPATMEKEKINHLILNFFIQEGHQEAAVSFAKEAGISLAPAVSSTPVALTDAFMTQLGTDSVDTFTQLVTSHVEQEPQARPTAVHAVSGYSTIEKRREIKGLILLGHITEAIHKISEYFPTVLDSNNLLHFRLLRLNLIEMIRSHKLQANITNDDEKRFLSDVLLFVRENLVNKVTSSNKLLRELEITMSLLCFNFDPATDISDQKDLPHELRLLFDLSLRQQCYRVVNQAILGLEGWDGLEQEEGYHGPKYMNFNLDRLHNHEVQAMDIDYDYHGGYSANVEAVQKTEESTRPSEELEDELTKLQDLSLELKLERVMKLWVLTEVRLAKA